MAQAAALFLLVAVFFHPAANAGFAWDDSIVTGSRAVREWSGLWQLWFEAETAYRRSNTAEGHFWPVVYFTFWLEHKLWGFEPLGYHLFNVLLHFANIWLVWRLLGRLGARHLAGRGGVRGASGVCGGGGLGRRRWP